MRAAAEGQLDILRVGAERQRLFEGVMSETPSHAERVLTVRSAFERSAVLIATNTKRKNAGTKPLRRCHGDDG